MEWRQNFCRKGHETNNKPLTPTLQTGRLLTLRICLIYTLTGPFSPWGRNAHLGSAGPRFIARVGDRGTQGMPGTARALQKCSGATDCSQHSPAAQGLAALMHNATDWFNLLFLVPIPVITQGLGWSTTLLHHTCYISTYSVNYRSNWIWQHWKCVSGAVTIGKNQIHFVVISPFSSGIGKHKGTVMNVAPLWW